MSKFNTLYEEIMGQTNNEVLTEGKILDFLKKIAGKIKNIKAIKLSKEWYEKYKSLSKDKKESFKKEIMDVISNPQKLKEGQGDGSVFRAFKQTKIEKLINDMTVPIGVTFGSVALSTPVVVGLFAILQKYGIIQKNVALEITGIGITLMFTALIAFLTTLLVQKIKDK